MTDLKTPYLDSEINGMKFMVRDNSLSVIGTERLEEYQSIKEALKRLGELEEAAQKSLEHLRSERDVAAFIELKTVLND